MIPSPQTSTTRASHKQICHRISLNTPRDLITLTLQSPSSPPTRTPTELAALGVRLVPPMHLGKPPVLITVHTGGVQGLQHGCGWGQGLQVVDVGFEVFVEVVLVQELSVTGSDVRHPVAVVGSARAGQVGGAATPVN